MRILKVRSKDIQYRRCEFSQSLYASIKRIGLSFPIKVKIIDSTYQCIDGNKRLSAIQEMMDNENIDREYVHVIVVNDGSSRSNDCWRAKNTH